jgi:hypothetical protein
MQFSSFASILSPVLNNEFLGVSNRWRVNCLCQFWGVTKTRSETAERETPKTRNSGAKRSQKLSGPFRSLGTRGLTKMRNRRRETVDVSGSVHC